MTQVGSNETDLIAVTTESDSSTVNPEEEIDKLLQSEKPYVALKEVCERIPFFLEPEDLSKLVANKDVTGLIYRCLPTLKSSLENFMWMPVDQKDLFDEAVTSLVTHINEILESPEVLETYWFRQYISLKITDDIKMFIVKEHGLISLDDFQIVRFYYQSMMDDGTPPNIAEIEEWLRGQKTDSFLTEEASIDESEGNNDQIPNLRVNFREPVRLKNVLTKIAIITDYLRDSFAESAEEGNLEDVVAKQELEEVFFKLFIKKLRPIEKAVLRLRYYLIENEEDVRRDSSIEDDLLLRNKIAKILGIRTEEVRQIENRALRKLRYPTSSRLLRDFLLS